jgi:lysophospholipase L1-like esterase
LLKDGQKVLILGDSITAAGGYTQYVDAYLRTRFPSQRFELYNLGLPSETVTGLSEPDHPFPRPDVHTRVARALERIHPDVVIACYGMNDGIYYPFSEDRFEKYQAGIRSLREKAEKAGAQVVLLTPPPFDPVPMQAKLLPAEAPKFSWVAPYARYNDVLARYSDWLLTLRNEVPVGDPQHATMGYLQTVRRTEPAYTLAGDGIHPNANGHVLIAAELLKALGAPAKVDQAEIDARELKATAGQVSGLERDGDGLRFEWVSRLPMPEDPAWDPRAVEYTRLEERLNQYRLTIRGLPQGRYALYDGATHVGEISSPELARGIDLLRYPALSTNRNAAELLKLVKQRERLLSPAWLTSVGHHRPNTPAGLPLDEAQRRAEPLEQRLRELTQPVRLQLRLVPIGELERRTGSR